MSSAVTPIKIIKRYQQMDKARPAAPAEIVMRTERQVRRDIARSVGNWIEAWRDRATRTGDALRSQILPESRVSNWEKRK